MKIETTIKLPDLFRLRWVQIALLYLIVLVFMAANAYLITKDKMHAALIPIGLLVIYLAIYRFHWLFWITLFMVPLSIPLRELMPDLSFNLLLPTEPLLAGMLIIFVLRLALDGGIDRQVLKHPVTQIILFQVIWIFITSITSTMPGVSFKFLTSRLWFLAAFYFIAIQFFKDPTNIRRFLFVYLIPLAGIIIVITMKHASLGLYDQKMASPAVDPFFNDHTLYGAIIALFIPVAAGYVIQSHLKLWQRLGVLIILALLFTGFLFSYSRAAWLSLVLSLGVMLIILFRIPGRTVLLGFGLLVTAFFIFGKSVLMKMEKNDQDSSDNLAEHVQSISNITTDASNLERLNRWSCALRMWAKKPMFGWGPGTYMFQYAPFQKESQKTIISTNAGDAGNAHSEYLGPLSEMGIPGGLAMLALVITGIATGIRVYRRETQKEMKMLALVLIMGLFSYFLHGIMNNFLDTDKASAAIWGFLAILVARDLSRPKAKGQGPK